MPLAFCLCAAQHFVRRQIETPALLIANRQSAQFTQTIREGHYGD